MKITKIFKVFKKGSKAAGKVKGKKGEGGKFDWPSGIRVGIFGPTNSGKTVYFTILNEDCKMSKNLQISVTDNPTSTEFLTNYRMLWGMGTGTDAGTVVDLKGEKKFPESTIGDKVLQFSAILDQKKKLSVVTYDYNGEAISISKTGESTDKVLDFLSSCDGLMFFFDPKILSAELQVQEHVAAFVNMLQLLAPLDSRLPIPLALVINKADVLPGFKGEEQTVLIGSDEEHFVADDFDIFMERVLSSNRIAINSEWAGTVRTVLVKLREFLREVVGRTLDFQIFFISNTGDAPEKVGADVGRSIYTPPAKISSIGVKEPFYWLLNGILRNRRLTKLRKVTKFVTVLSLLWIVLFSLPNIYHFMYLLPRAKGVENAILKNYNNDPRSTISLERTSIIDSYRKYKNKFIVRNIFREFQVPAGKIEAAYKDFNVGKALTQLDNLMVSMSKIAADTSQWPGYNFSDQTFILKPEHENLLAEITELRGNDSGSVLFMRANRSLAMWDLFKKYIASARDTAAAGAIMSQINVDKQTGVNRSSAEDILADSFMKVATIQKKVVRQEVDTEAALKEFNAIKEEIAASSDPKFIFETAARRLKTIKNKLKSSRDAEQIAMINSFFKKIDKWQERRTFKYRIEAIPDNGHIHIAVTEAGGEPKWSFEETGQLFAGEEYKIKWKIGDDIYISFDDEKFECQLGKLASDRAVLTAGKYSLFNMEGDILFKNINKTISISFNPSLKDQLPRLE